MAGLTVIADLIAGIFKPAADLIDNVHTSKEEKLELQAKFKEIELSLITKLSSLVEKLIDAQKEVLTTEMKGSWMQKNWRPMLMMMIMAIIGNNYIVVPYLDAMFDWSVVLTLPKELWTLLTVGVGGYVGGRSVEKLFKKE